jgi:hypothetical protein
MLDLGRDSPNKGVVRPLGLLELVTLALDDGRAKTDERPVFDVRLDGRLGVSI